MSKVAATITYDAMSQSDLLDLAEKRGVQDLADYRKADLKALFLAQDEKDEKGVQTVITTVKARAEALKNPPPKAEKPTIAERIMTKAQESVGKAIAHRPKSEAVLASPAPNDAGPQDELANQAKQAEQRRVAATKRTLPIGAPGEDVVAAMKKRSEEIRSRPAPRTLIPSSKALDAVRFAHSHNETMHGIKPHEGLPPHVQAYEVLADATYFSRTGTYQLKKGSVVSETTHDMESIRLHHVQLREIDPEKTEILYSNLGSPIGLKTVPTEAKGA